MLLLGRNYLCREVVFTQPTLLAVSSGTSQFREAKSTADSWKFGLCGWNQSLSSTDAFFLMSWKTKCWKQFRLFFPLSPIILGFQNRITLSVASKRCSSTQTISANILTIREILEPEQTSARNTAHLEIKRLQKQVFQVSKYVFCTSRLTLNYFRTVKSSNESHLWKLNFCCLNSC